MGFRRGNDHSVMVYTRGNTDYVVGEFLRDHPMQCCIEEVAGDFISRLRLPAKVVEYVATHLEGRRPLEYRRDDVWCRVDFLGDRVEVRETYTSPEGVHRNRQATFSVTGFILACTLCQLAQAGHSSAAGRLESGQRTLRAEGLVGSIPLGWTLADTQPVLL